MPSVHCRTCKSVSQAFFVEPVDNENEKPVLHIRYCAVILAILTIALIF